MRQEAAQHRHYPLAILGPGALGLWFAKRLAEIIPVALIARSPERAAELRAGVNVAGEIFHPHAFGTEQVPEAEWVIVTVKAQDTPRALACAERMKPHGVLSIQNGVLDSLLRKALPALLVGQGVTYEGAYRRGSAVVHGGAGETLAPPGFEPLVQVLCAAGFSARVEQNIQRARVRKLLVNVCLNPVTAVFGIRNGDALKLPYAVHVRALAQEAAAVLAACGLEMDEAAALECVHVAAWRTASNRTSMLQDIEAGRKTEIEYLNAALLAMAEEQGMKAPTHRAFLQLIRLLECALPRAP